MYDNMDRIAVIAAVQMIASRRMTQESEDVGWVHEFVNHQCEVLQSIKLDVPAAHTLYQYIFEQLVQETVCHVVFVQVKGIKGMRVPGRNSQAGVSSIGIEVLHYGEHAIQKMLLCSRRIGGQHLFW